MPRITLAAAENRIREVIPSIDRTKLRRAAKLAKRQIEATDHQPTDAEIFALYKTITYQDPTGDEASKNADNAARRLAERKAS